MEGVVRPPGLAPPMLTANPFSAFVTGGVLLGVALPGGRTAKTAYEPEAPLVAVSNLPLAGTQIRSRNQGTILRPTTQEPSAAVPASKSGSR